MVVILHCLLTFVKNFHDFHVACIINPQLLQVDISFKNFSSFLPSSINIFKENKKKNLNSLKDDRKKKKKIQKGQYHVNKQHNLSLYENVITFFAVPCFYL